MQDNRNYRIELRGQMDEAEFNQTSPLGVLLMDKQADRLCLTVCTDQSGLIGLLRHLHGRGYVLLSINCELKEKKIDDRR